jgi:hypothetical protein
VTLEVVGVVLAVEVVLVVLVVEVDEAVAMLLVISTAVTVGAWLAQSWWRT